MKFIKRSLIAVLAPAVSWGSFCSEGSGLVKQWKEQSYWIEETVMPSAANPQVLFTSFRDKQNQVYIAPFNIKGDYQAKMGVDIKSMYTQKKFMDYCANDAKYGSFLTSSRHDPNNVNEFRIPLTYLPSPSLSKQSPYVTQKFVMDPKGLGVKVVLKNDSIVKDNASWADMNVDIELALSKAISQSLEKQLALGITGQVTLNLDRMDDLACDILKGNAELRFFHTGRMDNPLVELKSEIRVEDLFDIYDLLSSSKTVATGKEKRFFDAGAAWMKLENKTGGTSIADQAKAFKIVNQMLDTVSASVKKGITDQEMTCLAENESEFKKVPYLAAVSVIVKTQTLTQEMAGN